MTTVTALKMDTATNGRVSARNAPITGRSSHRHSHAGVPRMNSGGTSSVYAECWSMWTL